MAWASDRPIRLPANAAPIGTEARIAGVPKTLDFADEEKDNAPRKMTRSASIKRTEIRGRRKAYLATQRVSWSGKQDVGKGETKDRVKNEKKRWEEER